MFMRTLENAQASGASHLILKVAKVPDEYVQVPLHWSSFELTQAEPLQLYESQKPKQPLVTVTVHNVLVTVVPAEFK